MKDELIKKTVQSLKSLLIYPDTLDKDEWRQAEIINQKILNAINEILKL